GHRAAHPRRPIDGQGAAREGGLRVLRQRVRGRGPGELLMKRPSVFFAAAIAAIAASFANFAGCASDLTDDVEGKQCTESGECLPGYECDHATNICVEEGTVKEDSGAPDAPMADAGDSGPDGCPDGADGCTAICGEGETNCGGVCVK